MANAQHQSATAEHGTPSDIIEAARTVLGGIDLDPASDGTFNRLVQADTYFSERNNGFTKDWQGQVFLNPPGGCCDALGKRVVLERGVGWVYPKTGRKAPDHQSSMAAWWHKLSYEYQTYHTKTAIFVGFSLEVLQRTQSNKQPSEAVGSLIPLDFPFCVPSSRLQFSEKKGRKLFKGTAPTHANVLVLLPRCPPGTLSPWDQWQLEAFIREFSPFGKVVIPR